MKSLPSSFVILLLGVLAWSLSAFAASGDTEVIHEYPNGSSSHLLSWYSSNHAYYLDYPGNGMRILGPTSLSSSGNGIRHAVAHFTNPETPVRLGDGDSIILSAKVTPVIVNGTAKTNALRFGLFYSKNQPGNIFTYDTNGNVTYSGYMVLVDADSGNLTTYSRYSHTTTGAPYAFVLIASSLTTSYQAGESVSMVPIENGALQQDQTYDISLHITRVSDKLVNVNASISGGHLDTPASIISTLTDNNRDKAIAYEFDTIAFAVNPASDLDTVRFSDIKISIPPREGNLHIVRDPYPSPQCAAIGSSLTFSPIITGSVQRTALLRDDVEILSDENGNTTLTLDNLSAADTGNYTFQASNELGQVSSTPVYFEMRTPETVRTPAFSAYFANNMVLQRDKINPIRGTASPNATLTITLTNSTNNSIISSATGSADEQGNFLIPLSPGPASTASHTLSVTNTLESTSIQDVLIGDLWLCCGQSNMDWTMNQTNSGETTPEHILADIAEAANYPYIRVYKATNYFSLTPLDSNPKNTWYINKDNPGNTTAVGYYFARTLARTVLSDVPIALLDVNYGSTTAEAWMESSTLARLGYPQYATPEEKFSTNSGSSAYNAMLHPIRETAIAGILYYQGENNVGRFDEYQDLFPKLITHLREDIFKDSSLPFYFVQLPNINRNWAPMRAAQMKALALPNTAAAITIDVGDDLMLHPIDKTHVGFRLALHALRNNFGYTTLESTGPVALSATTIGNGNVIISFGQAPNAFLDPSKYKEGMPAFQLSANGKTYYDANATLYSQNGSIVAYDISSPSVANPTHLRYAWANTPSTPLYSIITNPDPMLGNSSVYALPASPFELTISEGPNIPTLSQDKLLAYAFSPNTSTNTEGKLAHLPQIAVSPSNTLNVTFTPQNPLIRYEIQESTDLKTWKTIDIIESSSQDPIIRESTSNITANPSLFLRIKVSPK